MAALVCIDLRLQGFVSVRAGNKAIFHADHPPRNNTKQTQQSDYIANRDFFFDFPTRHCAVPFLSISLITSPDIFSPVRPMT